MILHEILSLASHVASITVRDGKEKGVGCVGPVREAKGR